MPLERISGGIPKYFIVKSITAVRDHIIIETTTVNKLSKKVYIRLAITDNKLQRYIHNIPSVHGSH